MGACVRVCVCACVRVCVCLCLWMCVSCEGHDLIFRGMRGLLLCPDSIYYLRLNYLCVEGGGWRCPTDTLHYLRKDVVWVTCRQPRVTYFFATFITPSRPISVEYLRLADLTAGFRRPCIADVKIGRRSYDPEATPDKITKELHKYPPQQTLCFQLKGMRVRGALRTQKFKF